MSASSDHRYSCEGSVIVFDAEVVCDLVDEGLRDLLAQLFQGQPFATRMIRLSASPGGRNNVWDVPNMPGI